MTARRYLVPKLRFGNSYPRSSASAARTSFFGFPSWSLGTSVKPRVAYRTLVGESNLFHLEVVDVGVEVQIVVGRLGFGCRFRNGSSKR